MEPLDAVRLSILMARRKGLPQTTAGLADGPILIHHPALTQSTIGEFPATRASAQADRIACMVGTFIVGVLAASRDREASAIYPDCHILLRPILRARDERRYKDAKRFAG